MNKIGELLSSGYIINGERKGASPLEMLRSCMASDEAAGGVFQVNDDTIVDELPDLLPEDINIRNTDIYPISQQLASICGKSRSLPLAYAAPLVGARLAGAILDAIWKHGHFRIEEISVRCKWEWPVSGLGTAAAFYESVEEVCIYLDGMGMEIKDFDVTEAEEPKVSFEAACPSMSPKRMLPRTVVGKEGNWLIYIPFDTCKQRLGGSLLSEVTGLDGGRCAEVCDPDYFLDCFEVVRELVEDKVAVSGVTVGDGGLMTALVKMLGNVSENGANKLDISGIMDSYKESDKVRILFGEVPGAVIEIEDSDYDYVDAELLLQDIAYYPLGQTGEGGYRIVSSGPAGISGILQSLMSSPAIEGED